MTMTLGRLILSGYGVAAVAAAALNATGLALWWAALVLWIGGAVATLALAAVVVARRPAMDFDVHAQDTRGAQDEAFARALAGWEDDRAADAARSPERFRA